MVGQSNQSKNGKDVINPHPSSHISKGYFCLTLIRADRDRTNIAVLGLYDMDKIWPNEYTYQLAD